MGSGVTPDVETPDAGRILKGANGCATTVMIDPPSRNGIGGAEQRHDCYAMAY
jgi:hypothetical protein